MISLAIFVLLLFLYSLVSGRLERTVITAPIVFTVAGMLMFPRLQGILKPGENSAIFLAIAEVGLVMLLFTEASRTDLNVLRSIQSLPARLNIGRWEGENGGCAPIPVRPGSGGIAWRCQKISGENMAGRLRQARSGCQDNRSQMGG